MKSKEGRVLDTTRRVQQFLTANAAQLGNINQSDARQSLDAAATQLTAHAADQAAGASASAGETSKQVQLRQTLRTQYMRPIAIVAKAQTAAVPELKSVRMPASNASVNQLVNHAYSMSEAVDAHATVFTGAGLDPNIASQLRSAADAVRSSVDTRAIGIGRRSNGTGGLAAAVKSATSALAVLNAVVELRLAGNPSLLSEWKTTSSVSAKLGPAVGTVVPPATSAAAPAATPSTPAVPVQVTPSVQPSVTTVPQSPSTPEKAV